VAERALITIVVDTTATFDDIMLARTRWMQLLSLCARGQVRLALPIVVLRETARHWEEQAQKALNAAKQRYDRAVRGRKEFADLGLGDLAEPQPVPDVTIDREAFIDELAQRLTSLGVELLPLPNVQVSTILDRDLNRRKPFADSGKGFRDSMIWHSVLTLVSDLSKNDTVYFVTGNTSDYCDGDNLHPDLLSEVPAPGADLRHVTSLDELVDTDTIRPLMARLVASAEELDNFLQAAMQAPEERLSRPSVSDLVREALESAAQTLAGEELQTGDGDRSGLDFSEIAIPRELESPTIVAVEVRPDTIDWHAYETYDDDTLLIRGTIEADIDIEGFIFKADYYGTEEEVTLIQFDWNDHYAFVTTTVTARLVFQLRVQSGVGSVEYTEFETAEALAGPTDD
jgi:hypothetical protein